MNFYKKLKNKEEVMNLIDKVYDEILDNDILYSVVRGNRFTIAYEYEGKNIYGAYSSKHKEIIIIINSHVNKSIACLIDTIAHEIAHIHVQRHNRLHTKLKMEIKSLLKNLLKYNKKTAIAA